MDYSVIRVMLSALPVVIYNGAADIFHTGKPPTSGPSRYLVVITVVINTHILTILLLKFFFLPYTSKVKGSFSCNYSQTRGRGENKAILEVNLNKQ